MNNRDLTVTGSRWLGWTSVGIGLMELLAPGPVQSLLGLDDRPSHRGILRVLGVRELTHGLSILTEKEPSRQMAASVWARVAGDMLDKAVLGIAAGRTKHPVRFAAITSTVLGIGLLDMFFSRRLLDERRQNASWLDRGLSLLGLGRRGSMLPRAIPFQLADW